MELRESTIEEIAENWYIGNMDALQNTSAFMVVAGSVMRQSHYQKTYYRAKFNLGLKSYIEEVKTESEYQWVRDICKEN